MPDKRRFTRLTKTIIYLLFSFSLEYLAIFLKTFAMKLLKMV